MAKTLRSFVCLHLKDLGQFLISRLSYILVTLGAHGDYFRLLLPGTYTVTATAPGFDPKTVSVTVGPAEPKRVSEAGFYRTNHLPRVTNSQLHGSTLC